MPIPKSVTKIDKNGVQFIDNVDATQYTLKELIRAALRDTGKYVARVARDAAPRRTGRGRRAIQYWNRKGKDGEMPHLLIGIKPSGFYEGFHELGTQNLPKVGMITHGVEQNIDKIREIQGQYLSAIADANRAATLIDEDEEVSDDE